MEKVIATKRFVVNCGEKLEPVSPVNALLDQIKETIIASAAAGGSISPSGTVAVSYGSSQSLTISPSTGYKIINVMVNGISIGPVTNYLFGNVMANHTSFGSIAH